MKQEQIKYADLIARKFVRENLPQDKVHFDIHGWEDFVLFLELTKKVTIHWCSHDRTCKVWRLKHEGSDEMVWMPVYNLRHLDELIAFYKMRDTPFAEWSQYSQENHRNMAC